MSYFARAKRILCRTTVWVVCCAALSACGLVGINVSDSKIYLAASKGDLARVEQLLAANANPDDGNRPSRRPPLMVAIVGGHEEIVRILLDAGANPNLSDDRGNTPLMTAAGQDWRMTVFIDASGRMTTTQQEASKGTAAIAELLLARGADPKATNQEGFAPLQFAAMYGRARTAKLLLSAQADPNFHARKSPPPLLIAADRGHGRIVAELIQASANPDVADRLGQTALMLAAYAGYSEIVQALLDGGATPSAQDENGFSPLSNAAYMDRVRVIEILIAGGAAVNTRDRDGKTPLGTALARGHTSSADVLRSAGGQE